MTKKNKPQIKLGFMESLSIVSSIFIFVLLIKNSSLASNEVINALKMCASTLIPSIFPLTVASEIITNSGAIEKITQKFSSPLAKLLGVNKNAVAPYLLGILGGYTISSKCAVLLYKNGKISKGDCESIIALSGIPSIAFMTGFVGIGVFKNAIIGWKLWLIAIFSTLILGIINRSFFKNEFSTFTYSNEDKKPQKTVSRIIVDAIGHSAYAMLMICACVVFFSVLIAVLCIYLNEIPISQEIKSILLGTLEITKGISMLSIMENFYTRAITCAFLVGWSGLCVHFQIIALTEETEITFKKYFLFKGLQAIICTMLSAIVFGFE